MSGGLSEPDVPGDGPLTPDLVRWVAEPDLGEHPADVAPRFGLVEQVVALGHEEPCRRLHRDGAGNGDRGDRYSARAQRFRQAGAIVDLPAPGDPAMPRSTRSRRGQLLDPHHRTVLVDGVEVGEPRRSAALTLTLR